MTYAVKWRENGGSEFVGKLDLEGDCVELLGSAAGKTHSALLFHASELADVHLRRRSGASPADGVGLVLVDRDGTEILLTPLQGMGVAHEIADWIADVCGKSAA